MSKNCQISRPRRLRFSPSIRSLVRENFLRPADLIQPFFVVDGTEQKQEILTLPDNYRYSIDLLIPQVQKCYNLGMRAIALFPVTPKELKDETGTEALNENNLICRTIRAIKDVVPEMLIISDVALDPYTIHGHDGVLDEGLIMKNDETINILVGQALNQARAGSDIVAPSDMCDGRILRIREALEENGFYNVLIMSYAAKYASNFYSPFRDAVDTKSLLKTGDKKNYQMDFANHSEAFKEVAADIQEGADLFIVKPAMNYLDVIARIYDKLSSQNIPLFAYQVSGEYTMLMLAIQNGIFEKDLLIYETMIAFKRAGCNGILTYFAQYMLENWEAFEQLQK